MQDKGQTIPTIVSSLISGKPLVRHPELQDDDTHMHDFFIEWQILDAIADTKILCCPKYRVQSTEYKPPVTVEQVKLSLQVLSSINNMPLK
jgi:hypothetical protein